MERQTRSRTTPLNPIEIQWQEIKASIADLGGLEKMRDAILYNKEIPIVKLCQWLCCRLNDTDESYTLPPSCTLSGRPT